MRFTREVRQKIVREFAEENGGWFDPAAFLARVREVGPDHPAWSWFEWDQEKAALEFQLDQARDFARGLVVRFEVETVYRGKMRVQTQTMPLLTSPKDSRRSGGGYFVTDPKNPQHMVEHCQQAAGALDWFIRRYHAAVSHVGGDVARLERLKAELEAVSVAMVAAE